MGGLFGLFGVFLIIGSTAKQSYSKTTGVPPGKPTGLTLSQALEPSADHGVIARIRWRTPPSNSTLSFYVRYREDKARNPSQKRVTRTSAALYLKPNTKYIIKVMALDEDNQQGPWSDDFIVQTGDSVPTKAPTNVTATSRDSSSILVNWLPIPEEYRNGLLLGYIVFYRKAGSRKWRRRTISSAGTFSYVIPGLLPGESYIVAVAGYTKNGTGKKSVGVVVDRSLPTLRPTTRPPSTTNDVTTAMDAATTEYVAPSRATVPRTMANNIPKPSTTEASFMLETHSEIFQITTGISKSPDAQANKDITETKTFSLELVYKFIAPAAIGGLILVLLIICFMWHQRRTKKKRKQQQEMEAMSLRTLSENKNGPEPKDTVRSKGEVTRGEGSIRYAPPKSYNTAAPTLEASAQGINITPNQLAQFDESHTTLSVISENESSGKCESQEACKSPNEKPERRNYSEVLVGKPNKVEDERYVKHGEKSKIYAEPFANKPAPSSPAKSTSSEAKYENMQHLYECLDVKDDKGSPLYMNIDGFTGDPKPEGDDLYEEIPAARPESQSEEREPLLLQTLSNEEEKAQ